MNVLEKILEEIKEIERKNVVGHKVLFALGATGIVTEIEEIIHSHMNHNGNDTEMDGWIPVSEELPPFGEKLQATILHHEWIADYDSSWVPEEERTYHQEYTEVCEIYPMGGMWFYACKEDEYQRDIAYIKPKKDLGNPISEIIAWRPLPEPYKGGE